MTIFTDRHHQGLYESLKRLFEKRFGAKLYTMTGMAWYEKKYWDIFPSIGTARQYLLEKADDRLTFEEFQNTPIDIVIASIPQHVKPFKELAQMKNAKFIFQMGNIFNEVNLNEIPNLMANTLPRNIPPTCHYISYHQEIDPVYKPSSIPPERLITSFINVYYNNKGFEDYMALKSIMPGYTFKNYGGQNQDGAIAGDENISAIMNRSQFGFHSKYMGDGFGHILYAWMASGKPVITRISDYKGKLGEELLSDGVTCFNLDICTIDQLYDTIINVPPDKYNWMCQQARKRFEDCVDYEKETENIKKFLEELN
jgi:hypothetical protein